jgi:endonuclease YncB( thermonuclease family)
MVLTQTQWLKLEKILDSSHDLTYEKTSKIRHAVVRAPERADYRDRWNSKEPTPFARVAKHRFREDGLLLPFGHSRAEFDTPNM